MKTKYISNEYWSNCLVEMIRAKIKNPSIKITYISPFINEVFCPHFMWSDGVYDYDFGIDKPLKIYQTILFKGYIRQRKLGFNERWKKSRLEKYNGKSY